MVRIGTAGRIAQVPLSAVWHCSCASVRLVAPRLFLERNDAQIAALEMAALLLAIGTWGKELRGRRIVLFSDNTVAQCCFQRGAAKAST